MNNLGRLCKEMGTDWSETGLECDLADPNMHPGDGGLLIQRVAPLIVHQAGQLLGQCIGGGAHCADDGGCWPAFLARVCILLCHPDKELHAKQHITPICLDFLTGRRWSVCHDLRAGRDCQLIWEVCMGPGILNEVQRMH